MKKFSRIFVSIFLSVLFSSQVFAGWQQAGDNQWKYEKDGAFLANQWFEDQGNWYYLDENGLMIANATRNIEGTEYSFDSTGKCLNYGGPGRVYMNNEMGYSICIPADTSTNAFDGQLENFDISAQNMLLSFYNEEVPGMLDPETYASVFELGFFEGTKESKIFIEKEPVQIGDFHFNRTRYDYGDGIILDFYIGIQGHKMLAIAALYIPETERKTQEVLNSLYKI